MSTAGTVKTEEAIWEDRHCMRQREGVVEDLLKIVVDTKESSKQATGEDRHKHWKGKKGEVEVRPRPHSVGSRTPEVRSWAE